MTYLDAINKFWQEAIHISGYKSFYGITYFSILDFINNNRWKPTPIDLDRILHKTRISKKMYYESLKWLNENKLIDYTAGENSWKMAIFNTGIEYHICTSTDTSTHTPTLPLPIPLPYPLKEDIKTIREKDRIDFNNFRILYGGTKKGNDTEFENFIKKHKDWKIVLPTLVEIIKKQIAYRELLFKQNKFVPEWKNLQTWINQRCWEEEIPVIQILKNGDAPSNSIDPRDIMNARRIANGEDLSMNIFTGEKL